MAPSMLRAQHTRAQHVGALINVSPNTKIPRARGASPSGQRARYVPTARLSSPSSSRGKYQPVYVLTLEESNYHEALASVPESLHHLGTDASSASPSPNIGTRRDLGPRVPLTPPLTLSTGARLIPIDETDADGRASPFTPSKIYKGTRLDKELPAKPMLRSFESPERRGLYDALDNDVLSLKHPVLQPSPRPSSSNRASPDSFRLASSLGTASTLGEVETGVAVAVEGGDVDVALRKDIQKGKRAIVVANRGLGSGSPMLRVRGLSTMGSDSSLNRRAARCSVGPTLRKTEDCHSVIMGSSPYPSRTSSLPKPVSGSQTAASRLSRPTKASASRAAEAKKNIAKPSKFSFGKQPPSKSPLSANKGPDGRSANKSPLPQASKRAAHSRSVSKPSFMSTIKPVANDAPADKAGSHLRKVSMASSTTSTSVKTAGKGLKSRFSEIFSGRRRSSIPTTANNKGSALGKDDDDTTPLTSSSSIRPIKRASTTGVVEKKTSPINTRAEKSQSMSAIQVPREQQSQHSGPSSTTAASPTVSTSSSSGTASGSSNPTSSLENLATGPSRGGNNGPPTPPHINAVGSAHYNENEIAINAASQAANLTEAEFDDYLAGQLDNAEANLRVAIERANHSTVGDDSMVHVNAVLRALGRTIVHSRQVLIAGIDLRATTTNLIEHTTLRAESARSAVFDALQSAAAARSDLLQSRVINAHGGTERNLDSR